MQGDRNKLKEDAIKLRQQGCSYPMILEQLGVPKGTQNSWFKGIVLNKAAQQKILNRKRDHLHNSRKKALEVLNNKRMEEILEIKGKAIYDLNKVKLVREFKELLLASLYLGEGFKCRSLLGLGNSNLNILLIFIRLLEDVYDVDRVGLKCYLHLRFDQKDEKEKRYWSKNLGIPIERFGKSQFDRRTRKSETWESYHGVCTVYCYKTGLEKRLRVVREILADKILN